MNMADDGEIDIEGDFELKLESDSGVGYDLNELPSKSANLLPEFTNPPWMLEQGWSLDTCLDEKSKATIEKMLQEEQNYLNGRSHPKSPIKKADHRKGSTHKKPWTEEEKQFFIRGLEIYGRSWTKISELIPSRTSLQVKNYAHQHFKQQNKLAEARAKMAVENSGTDSVSASISSTLASVTTGQPTVQTTGLNKRGKHSRADNCALTNHIEIAPLKLGISTGFIPLTPPTDSLGVIRADIDGVLLVRDLPGENLLSPGGSSGPDNASSADDAPDNSSSVEEEEDVDIDIVNEDAEDNAILQSRSASPSSVYEALLKSANVRKRPALSNVTNYKQERDAVTPESVESVNMMEDESEPSPQSDECLNAASPSEDLEPTFKDLATANFEGTPLSKSARSEDIGINIVIQNSYQNCIVTSRGEIIELPVPQTECVLLRDEITDQEKAVHTEFFDGRPSKTPQRYLKIRNYIIDSWTKCRPEYLNKTSVRPGLKNCGDVNCIGRIHTYLEQCGAINFGCEQACYNRPTKPCVAKDLLVEDKPSLSVEKMEAMRPRKRKVRDSFGFWVDEKDAEGKTIDHSQTPVEHQSPSNSKTMRLDRYDPFKLIPCFRFEEKEPPFGVEIHSTALAIVDIHSHISKTEVIGLLGGRYDSTSAHLQIVTAEPCVSISTGMQCEMDPVSQTVAAEKIGSSGLSIVGWYHSHPTFTPNPSVRDLETQLKFQDWFSKGGSNFVGLIVNPYQRNGPAIQSEFRCLTVSDETSATLHCNIPYQFDFKVAMEEFSEDLVLRTASDIMLSHRDNPHSVDLLTVYRSHDDLTCLNKMLQSLQSYLPMGSDSVTSFLECIQCIFSQRPTIVNEEVTVDVRDDADFDITAADVIS